MLVIQPPSSRSFKKRDDWFILLGFNFAEEVVSYSHSTILATLNVWPSMVHSKLGGLILLEKYWGIAAIVSLFKKEDNRKYAKEI